MTEGWSARDQILALTDSDLVALARLCDGHHSWAKRANIQATDLVAGRPRAVGAIRVALRRGPAGFIHEVGAAINDDLVASLESREVGSFLHGLRADFTVEVVRAALACVLSKAEMIPEIYRNEVAALMNGADLIDNSLENVEVLDESPDRLVDGSSSDPEDPDPLAAAQRLMKQATALAGRVRQAAEDIESGVPPDSAVTAQMNSWAEQAQQGLAAFPALATVPELIAVLQEQTHKQRERVTLARNVLHKVETLRENDMPELIIELLRQHGFTNEQDLQTACDGESAPLDRPVPSLTETANENPQSAENDGSEQPLADTAALLSEPLPPMSDGDAHDDSEEQSPAVEDSEPQVGGPELAEWGLEPSTPETDGGTEVDSSTSPPIRERVPAVPANDEPAGKAQTTDPEVEPPIDRRQTAASTIPDINCDDAVGTAGTTGGTACTATAEPHRWEAPWDNGSPSLLAQLISQGLEPLAIHLAEAADESPLRVQWLKLVGTSWHYAPDSMDWTDLLPTEQETADLAVDEARVVLGACLRLGMHLGYPPLNIGPLLERSNLQTLQVLELTTLLELLGDVVQRGYRHDPEQSTARITGTWDDLAHRLRQIKEEMPRRRIKYHRGTLALQRLLSDDHEIGRAVAAGLALADGTPDLDNDQWALVEDASRHLASHEGRDKLIDGADRRTGPGSRAPIIAGARAQLHDRLQEVSRELSALNGMRNAVRSAGGNSRQNTSADIAAAVDLTPLDLPANTVGEAVLTQLVAVLRHPDLTPWTTLDLALNNSLFPCFEIPRDKNQIPERKPTAAEVMVLIAGRTTTEVVDGYLQLGNIAGARDYLNLIGTDPAEYEDVILDAAHRRRKDYEANVARARRAAARFKALELEAEATELSASLEALTSLESSNRLDLTFPRLQSITQTAESTLRLHHDRLLVRTSQLTDPAVRDRISARLAAGDENLALEFLVRAENGKALPVGEEVTGDDFQQFFPAAVDAAHRARETGGDVISAVTKQFAGEKTIRHEVLRSGASAWRELKISKRRSDTFDTNLRSILTMLGLAVEPRGFTNNSLRAAAGFGTYTVRARPIDGSYVPLFGTQSLGRFNVTVVWDRSTPSKLLDLIEVGRTKQANIILYLDLMSSQNRAELRRLTRPDSGKGFSPIVVDDTTIGWLMTRPEPGWKYTQRVTLPFTTINPYKPFAGGEVPEEVFVGREEEREKIEDPSDSLFVYGGRQLGKSALLRRVEHLFTEQRVEGSPRVGHVALYIDLKAHGIGESAEPAALWPLLLERLRDEGMAGTQIGRSAGPDEIVKELNRWFNADESNRLLLLLDEADNFLTVDARGHTGGSQFTEFNRLKSLMSVTKRRFKPVFAGLHQVQRFHAIPNTPVGQHGTDILIGPLSSAAAYRLVRDPMMALGYRFGSDDIIWRLLMYTNYQASLVQVMCEALVDHMRNRRIPDAGNRITVDDEDLAAVFENHDVRERLAERFRWTINLDNRYRVIALVVAYRSSGMDAGSLLEVQDIRRDCLDYWPTGFQDQDEGEFRRYLSEMIGLGVLYGRDDRYVLRNPYIARMLGTPSTLEAELYEAEETLELPPEYDPTRNRRIVGETARPEEPRSPLTDGDISRVLGLSETAQAEHGFVIYGGRALNVELVGTVLQTAASDAGVELDVRSLAQARELASRQVRKDYRLLITIGENGWDNGADAAEVCNLLMQRPQIRPIVVVDPIWRAVLEPLTESGLSLIRLRRLSPDELRHWHDSRYDTPVDRLHVHRVASGWPKLVERSMKLAENQSINAALEQLSDLIRDRGVAGGLIEDSGVPVEEVKAWATYLTRKAELDGLIEAIPSSTKDIQEAIGKDPVQILAELEELDMVQREGDKWVLDRVLAEAAFALTSDNG